MLKPKTTPLIFIFLFSLSIPIRAQSQQRTASAGNATVSGRVTLNGEPARGLAVVMQPQRQLHHRAFASISRPPNRPAQAMCCATPK